ncbi:MFS transporter [Halobacteria archaeon AArc-curdl1]|uniref:MFS transporter n=1 Tax=Natronosalvus hydrolyticus TaxID=2979988 RepID=A0AAP2Z7W0_9EURY|nr:MFS transporter [Halobacteria archaeon AArc-curdl1]
MDSLGAPPSSVVRYYLFQAADSIGFIWPVFTLFLLWNDLTYAQIGTLSAVSALLVVALEVPTGYVADRYGRRNALALGMLAMTVSTAGFVVAETFAAFLVLYGLWALSLSLQSGTVDAWLYATLDGRGESDAFTRVRGRGGAVYQWSSAITMVAGGLLYVSHPLYPFVASAALNGLGFFVVLSMPRNAGFESGELEGTVDLRESLAILRDRLNQPQIRLVVGYVALFFAVVSAADTYIQPITVDVLEELATDDSFVAAPVALARVPEEAVLGFIYAGFAAIAALASDRAVAVRRSVGLQTALAAIPVCVALTLLLPRAFPLFAIPVFFLMKGTHELLKPLIAQFLNDRTGDAGRATVLSAASMIYATVRAPLLPVVGFVADTAGPLTAIGGLGGTFLIVALVAVVIVVSFSADPAYRTLER